MSEFGLPDFFAPGVAAAFVLTALRVGGLLLIAPAWSAKSVPMRLRTATLVLFGVLLLPAAQAHTDVATLRITPATFLAESAVGFMIGMSGALVIAAAEFAGELATTTIGLSGAAIFDPINNTQGAILQQFMQVMALIVVLIGGGHIIMLQAIAESFASLPLGSPLAIGDGAHAMVRAASSIFVTGVQFAAPVIAAVLLLNLALAVLGRAAPQLNIMGVAFPLQIGGGLITFAGSLALIVHAMSDWTPGFGATIDSMARATRAPASSVLSTPAR
ncbi:MAG: flagellar biosynthetic protein FliR [Gemmatimonadaceae bacterium]|nr:flagellar biosynthetic protein FliR [Gemmatimonadaceae bacterium]